MGWESTTVERQSLRSPRHFQGFGTILPKVSYVIPISSFAPEPYATMIPLQILLTPSDDGFMASFFDANIHSAGDTEEEAIENLKSLILDIFEMLTSSEPETLGPSTRKQLARLQSFIRWAG
ncbi:MAG: hypothetical protein AABZ34_17235 [Nitrospirota bacterium]